MPSYSTRSMPVSVVRMRWVESGNHWMLPTKMGEYCALNRMIDSKVEMLVWSEWKADGEEISSAGIGSAKLGRRVSFEGVNSEVIGGRFEVLVLTVLVFGVGEGDGEGRAPCAIMKFLSSLIS